MGVAAHGNASLVAFVRSSPGFIRLLNADPNRAAAIELSRRVLALTKEIAAVDGEAALACFRSSARALRSVSIEQFEAWARRGLSSGRADTRARRSYFSLETRGSYEALHSGSAGLALDSVQHLLRLYVEALTGREVDIAPLAAVPDEARIDDGRTIHLPSLVNEFGDEDLDFDSTKCWPHTLRDRLSLALTSAADILRAAHASDRREVLPKRMSTRSMHLRSRTRSFNSAKMQDSHEEASKEHVSEQTSVIGKF